MRHKHRRYGRYRLIRAGLLFGALSCTGLLAWLRDFGVVECLLFFVVAFSMGTYGYFDRMSEEP